MSDFPSKFPIKAFIPLLQEDKTSDKRSTGEESSVTFRSHIEGVLSNWMQPWIEWNSNWARAGPISSVPYKWTPRRQAKFLPFRSRSKTTHVKDGPRNHNLLFSLLGWRDFFCNVSEPTLVEGFNHGGLVGEGGFPSKEMKQVLGGYAKRGLEGNWPVYIVIRSLS